MTVTSIETRYVHEVAAEVRAMAARHRITGKQIGQHLGHASIETTQRYVWVDREALEAAVLAVA